jgi:hypothetical protein
VIHFRSGDAPARAETTASAPLERPANTEAAFEDGKPLVRRERGVWLARETRESED